MLAYHFKQARSLDELKSLMTTFAETRTSVAFTNELYEKIKKDYVDTSTDEVKTAFGVIEKTSLRMAENSDLYVHNPW